MASASGKKQFGSIVTNTLRYWERTDDPHGLGLNRNCRRNLYLNQSRTKGRRGYATSGSREEELLVNASQTIAALAASMAKAQASIEGATKDKTNPHFRSNYADLSSVVAAIKQPLADNGLWYTQVMHDAEAAAKVETIIVHSSGEWLSCGVLSVPVVKNDAQGYGSALTYARRYSLSAAFGVAPEDDDGNAAVSAAPQKNGAVRGGMYAQLLPEQRAKIDAIASEVIDCFEAGAPDVAYGLIFEAGLDNDEKAGLWGKFDSKMRAALKKIGDAKKPPLPVVEPREKDLARAEARGTA
jgi:hypothetical protein